MRSLKIRYPEFSETPLTLNPKPFETRKYSSVPCGVSKEYNLAPTMWGSGLKVWGLGLRVFFLAQGLGLRV